MKKEDRLFVWLIGLVILTNTLFMKFSLDENIANIIWYYLVYAAILAYFPQNDGNDK